MFIRQEVADCRKQERAELGCAGSDLAEPISLEQMLEKCLRKVLGVMLAIAAPPDIAIKRVPVSVAETIECPGLIHTRAVASGEYDTPASGAKLSSVVY